MKDAQIKKIRKIWEAEMSAMGGSIGTTFHGVREDATYTSGYIRGQSLGSSKSVTGILGDLKKARIASVDFADEVGKAAQETEFVYKNAAKIFGFLGDDTKSSMGKVNTQAGQYMGTLEGLGKQLQFTDDQYKINGLSLEVFAGKGGKGLRKLGESYTYLANKTTLAYHATRDLGEQGAIDLFKLTKSTEISMEDMRSVVERQFSLTGTASSKMVRELVAYSQQLGKSQSVSAKLLRENAIDIIKATRNFGNVTAEEAIRIGHNLLEIGIGFQELNGMVGKLQGFESAVGVVGDLTTVFGVQLDAMELMRLATEDQGQLLHYLRDSFDAAGMSASDMNLPMKRLLQDLLGVGDIEVVERIFSDRSITSVESMQSAMHKASEADLTKAMTDLHKDMPLFYSDIQSVSKLVKTDLDQVLRVQLGGTLNAAAKNLTHFGGKVRTELLDTAGVAVKGLSTGINDISKVDPQKIAAVATQLNQLQTAITSGDPKKMAEFAKQLAALSAAGGANSKMAKEVQKNFRDLGGAGLDATKDMAQALGIGKEYQTKMAKYSEDNIKQLFDTGAKGKAELQKLFTDDPVTFMLNVPAKYIPKSLPEYLEPVVEGAKIFGKEYRNTITGDTKGTFSEMNRIIFNDLNKQDSKFKSFHEKLISHQKKYGQKGLEEYGNLLRAHSGLTKTQIEVMSDVSLSTQLDTMKRQRENIKESLLRNKEHGIKSFSELNETLQGRLRQFGFKGEEITTFLSAKAASNKPLMAHLIGDFGERQQAGLFGEPIAQAKQAQQEDLKDRASKASISSTNRHVSKIQKATKQMTNSTKSLQKEMNALKTSLEAVAKAVNSSATAMSENRKIVFQLDGDLGTLIDKISAHPETAGLGIKVMTSRPSEKDTSE
jgi:hypothetical protein